jgi:uncharacterized membrane protein (DUF106 family)
VSRLNELILQMMNAALGWMLAWPRSLTLIALSVLTAAILVVIRRFTTDQDLLERCVRDKRRLKVLSRLARRSKDNEALGRYRTTASMIAMVKARSEVKPLLVSLLPIALLAIWACQRVAYVPPRAGQDVAVTMYLPVSAEGRLMHLVPMDGVECGAGWVQQASLIQQGAPSHCQAKWTLRAASCDQPYDLTFRYAGATYHKPLRVGQAIYEPPVQAYSDAKVLAIETRLEECKLFGIVSGIRWLAVPPWLAAYSLVSIPAMLLLKRVLRVR